MTQYDQSPQKLDKIYIDYFLSLRVWANWRTKMASLTLCWPARPTGGGRLAQTPQLTSTWGIQQVQYMLFDLMWQSSLEPGDQLSERYYCVLYISHIYKSPYISHGTDWLTNSLTLPSECQAIGSYSMLRICRSVGLWSTCLIFPVSKYEP